MPSFLKILLTSFLCFFLYNAFAQSYPYTPPIIAPKPLLTSEDYLLADYLSVVDRSINKTEKFKSDQFFNGYMVFHSGKTSPVVKMNYNRYLGRMEMIDKKGDTVSVTEAFSVKYIMTENGVYFNYPLKGYFEIIAGLHHPVKLILQESLNLIHHFEAGGPTYNTRKLYSTTIVIKTLNGKYIKERVLFERKKHYYLMARNEKFYKANISGFIKAFPQHEKEIRKYIRVQVLRHLRIPLRKEEDLKKLLDHCLQMNREKYYK